MWGVLAWIASQSPGLAERKPGGGWGMVRGNFPWPPAVASFPSWAETIRLWVQVSSSIHPSSSWMMCEAQALCWALGDREQGDQ